MKLFALGWFAGAVFAAAGMAYILVPAMSDPYCPTEDSCTVSYENGAWKIMETTP